MSFHLGTSLACFIFPRNIIRATAQLRNILFGYDDILFESSVIKCNCAISDMTIHCLQYVILLYDSQYSEDSFCIINHKIIQINRNRGLKTSLGVIKIYVQHVYCIFPLFIVYNLHTVEISHIVITVISVCV